MVYIIPGFTPVLPVLTTTTTTPLFPADTSPPGTKDQNNEIDENKEIRK